MKTLNKRRAKNTDKKVKVGLTQDNNPNISSKAIQQWDRRHKQSWLLVVSRNLMHADRYTHTHTSHKLPMKETCIATERRNTQRCTQTQTSHCMWTWGGRYKATDNLVTTLTSAIPKYVYFPHVQTFMSIIIPSCGGVTSRLRTAKEGQLS